MQHTVHPPPPPPNKHVGVYHGWDDEVLVGGWVEFFGGELVELSWSTIVIAVDTTIDFLNHKRDNKINCMNYNYDT